MCVSVCVCAVQLFKVEQRDFALCGTVKAFCHFDCGDRKELAKASLRLESGTV